MGTPFDYPHQGILYTAARLPRPGREGLSDEVLAQIAELVWAAGDGHWDCSHPNAMPRRPCATCAPSYPP